MADQETKIAACPMPGCGKEIHHIEGSGQIWCSCGYELVSCTGTRPEVPYLERELIERHNKLSLAAHNALATASARPKDVAGLRGELQDAKLLAKNRSETIERYVPEINQLHRQRDKAVELLRQYGSNTENKDCVNVCNCCGSGFGMHDKDCEIGKIIADCEATT